MSIAGELFDGLATNRRLGGPDREYFPAHQVRAEVVAYEGLELGPGEALVAQDDLPGGHEVVVAFEQRPHHLPF